MSTGREIRLTEEDDWWVAHDVETGVASQGETREEALEMLDEAVALHRGEAGRPVTEDDLREWGIDPDEVDLSEAPSTPDAPWFDDAE
jgi:predicted RNase H-like HicB family nuclease